LEELARLLCLERRKTPCLWHFLKARELSREIGVDLKKERRPGVVLEFLEAEGESLERVAVVFLSTKKLFPRQPKVEVGRECSAGSCEGIRNFTSFVFYDLSSGECIFRVPLRFLKDASSSRPCGLCEPEIKKRLFDACGGY